MLTKVDGMQLVQIAIHQHPASNVIELIQGPADLSHSVMCKLPSGVILSSHVRYAMLDDGSSKPHTADVDESVFGKSFTLGALSTPESKDIARADLILIPHKVSNDLARSPDSNLERLSLMAKPGAIIIIAAPAAAGNIEEVASPTLKAKGFELVSTIPAPSERLVLYRHTGSNEKQLTDGVHREQIVFLESISSSTESQLLSKHLEYTLEDQGYFVASRRGFDDLNAVEGKICISLLELEKPLLADLSESDFQNIRKLMVSCGRLVWLTCGDNPSFGLIDGLARCLNGELGSKFQVLHLSNEGMQHGPSLTAHILKASDTTDKEFREQNGLLQVQRVYNSPDENNHIRNHLEDSTQVMSLNDDSAHFRLTIGKPGLLDSLHFVRDEIAPGIPLADDELEIQVKATGVNFRDIMASMGLVPMTGLGQEASGTVFRTGSRAAKSFKLGDRVSTVSVGGSHATKARCDFRVTSKMPDTMSFEEGAAVPMVHATAYYALVRLAKLRRGQSVLIHAATGGVGQAAVQLAKHLGLVVYVTVGTEDKRRFLIEQYGIPEEDIFNSRDSSFAKGIHRVTGGRGVDCVLNSLSGELLRVSWTCLATFGTFVEIGRRDITDNMRLDMRPFSKSCTFTLFDIPTLINEDPAALGVALNEVFQLLHEGIVHVPYPMTVYPVGRLHDAFRIIQQGKHRGKIVLSFSEEDKAEAPVLSKAKDSLKLDSTATYLFVGGLGGLGRSLAKEFVASGARYIAFVSRSGNSSYEAAVTVDELAALGAEVKVFRGDVADQDSFLAAMRQCSQQLPLVKGVVQMAMVLRDTVFENMSLNDWTIGLRPKVQGTWNLHQYFDCERPLDFMVFASSISGLIGNPGQAQYDAGNSYQDHLAHYRRARGLRAVSINLGVMLDVGVIAESVEHNFKVWEQALGIREPVFHALMKSVINGQQQKRGVGEDCPAQISTGLGTADMLALRHLPSPPWFQDSRFGPLAVASTSAGNAGGEGARVTPTAPLTSRLTEAGNKQDHAAATEIITGALVKKTADILRIPPSEIDPSRPMYSYGVDSLVAMEVRNWITSEMKANLTLLDILAAVPMETTAAQIAQKSKLVGALP